ncbi:MAG: helix-turn-helix transcriptional regulator [Eubacteriales bacterium]|nr:helix-turn-helix transcriptional regulator [Eubacteriales bacterium]
MTLGEKIIAIRKAHNLNQQQFADKFHVTRQTVSNWENNRNYPDMSSLKMISDEYGISFDELLKEDTAYIKKVDDAKKKMSAFKRAFIITLAVLISVTAGFFLMLHYASQPTPDGKRINSDASVRMLVNLPDSAPARAITFTSNTPKNDKEFKDLVEKYESASKGRVEGDIPCIILNDKPKITFYFQNLDYRNISPKKILSVRADSKNVLSDHPSTKTSALKYNFKNGEIIIDPAQIKYDRDEGTGEIWYDVSFVIRYRYNGSDYTSVTTLTVMNNLTVMNSNE